MTDLEIPQLQVGRYLDLLKRRRWQLIPAGLLGLAVGLAVAWMIPRYYEADTIVRIRPLKARAAFRPDQDPFLEEIRAARITVRNYALVREAMRRLGWASDPEVENPGTVFRAKVQAVIGRITVDDLHKGDPGRRSALLSISYRDLDKDRSAKMANMVRELYIDREYTAIVEGEQRQMANLVEVRHAKLEEYRGLFDDLRKFLEDSGLDPEPRGNQTVETTKGGEAAKLESEIAAIDEDLKAKRMRVKKLADQLANLPRTIEITPAQSPQMRAMLGDLDTTIQGLALQLHDITRANPNYSAINSQLTQLITRRKLIMKTLEAKGLTKKVNPSWKKINESRVALKLDIETLESKRAGKSKRHEKLQLFLTELPGWQVKRTELTERVALAKKEYEAAKASYDAKEAKVAQLVLNRDDVIYTQKKAWAPLEPTYPNKAVVALLGGLLGLGVAIGLIFLLDVLQPTFKSIEEVGRGLSVPVLGGVSYLELEEAKARAGVRRLRIIVVVGVAAALIAGVFALYFFDPVRLPDWVRAALDKVFAGKSG